MPSRVLGLFQVGSRAVITPELIATSMLRYLPVCSNARASRRKWPSDSGRLSACAPAAWVNYWRKSIAVRGVREERPDLFSCDVISLPPLSARGRASMSKKQKQRCPICNQWAKADATVCKHCLGYLAPLKLPMTVSAPAAPSRLNYKTRPTTRVTRLPTVMALGLAGVAGVAGVSALVGGLWWLRPMPTTEKFVPSARTAESVTSGSATKPPSAVVPTLPIVDASPPSHPPPVVFPLPRPRPREVGRR